LESGEGRVVDTVEKQCRLSTNSPEGWRRRILGVGEPLESGEGRVVDPVENHCGFSIGSPCGWRRGHLGVRGGLESHWRVGREGL
jgi:hypothetical protein